MKNTWIALLALTLPVCLMLPAKSVDTPTMASADTHTADILDAQGNDLGTATLTELPHHGVLIHAQLSGVPEGWHAFHIHENGSCKAPDFKSAGGHFNPMHKQHGFENAEGEHAGDLPNVHVEKDGLLKADLIDSQVTLMPGQPNSLIGGNGTAIVLHQKGDDYHTNPAGAAGDRIACGVIH